jgi:hypothetical protein
MAYTRKPFTPKLNTALKQSDLDAGALPYLWSMEDVTEVYGGCPRKLNDQTVLRYKIDLHAILDNEKKAMLEEYKTHVDRDFEIKLLREENRIREDVIEKNARVNQDRLFRGGKSPSAKAVSAKAASAKTKAASAKVASTKAASAKVASIKAAMQEPTPAIMPMPMPAPMPMGSLRNSFGLKIINEFISNLKKIDFNTDMRIFEIDDTDPYYKNERSGGQKTRGRKTKGRKTRKNKI